MDITYAEAEIGPLLERVQSLPNVKVPASLRNPHPQVELLRQGFENPYPDSRSGLLHPSSNGQRLIPVTVSEKLIPRALRFLDALLKTIEKLGGTIQQDSSTWRPEMHVVFLKTRTVTLRLRERCKNKPTPEGRNYSPTGLLVLDQGSVDMPVCCQDTTKGLRIEDCINQIILGWVEKLAEKLKHHRIQEEANARRQAELQVLREREADLERRRQELTSRQDEERQKVEFLYSQAESWKKSQLIREYIAAMQQHVLFNTLKVVSEDKYREWLQWAKDQAARLDPFSMKPYSILDERIDTWT